MRRSLLPIGLVLFAYGHVSGKFLHWSCPLHSIFHVPCPTCGMTRATRALLHLDVHRAMHMNPLAPVVLPLLAALVAVELGGYVATGDFGLATNKKAVRIAGLAMCTALFVVWVARFFGAFGGPVR
jgi:hypothetical protein